MTHFFVLKDSCDMCKLQLKRDNPDASRGFLHLDSSLPIPRLRFDDGYHPPTIEHGFVVGHYVGTSFRVISCHQILDDARFAIRQDHSIHPERKLDDYSVLYVHQSIQAVL